MQLRDRPDDFLYNFEQFNFICQAQCTHHRLYTFSKMYALSLCQSYRTMYIVKHHSIELESIKEILVENSLMDNDLKLSIALREDENFVEDTYQYLYVIEVNSNVDFADSSELMTNICQVLGITKIYSENANVIMVLDDQLTCIANKQEKLTSIQQLVPMGDIGINEVLSQLNVEITELNRNILKKTLGIIKANVSTTSSEIFVNIHDYELIIHLHRKLIKIVTVDWSMKSIRKLIDFIHTEDELKYLLDALDPIYEYSLKEYESDVKGNSLFDILKSTSMHNWGQEIHDLALFQTFRGSYDKNLEQLKSEIYDSNEDSAISFLCDEKLLDAYENVQNAYKLKSELFDNFHSIEYWESSEIQ
ncbi:unnamed protein product [Rotaria sp. Silwood2]|nr:unnamed protein product [Rotaria sp. Silwood2]